MLPVEFSSILQAKSREDFGSEVERFARRLGFDTYSTLAVSEFTATTPEVVVVHNAPRAYQESFFDGGRGRRDPVTQHCKRASVPIIWNRTTYSGNGAEDLWEHQARFGYATGIAMALHLPEGRHFVFGVDRDRPLPDDQRELQRLVADLQLFAVYAQDSALRLLLSAPNQPERPALTPRELEVLRWTMDGKTAWEVGAILGISERTAVLHVSNAMRKLGCVNKHQAVLKALRLGLIH
jgi:DNA-binding CsgD family transcriptional regulator